MLRLHSTVPAHVFVSTEEAALQSGASVANSGSATSAHELTTGGRPAKLEAVVFQNAGADADVSIGLDAPLVVNAWDSQPAVQELSWGWEQFGREVDVVLTALTPRPHVFGVTMHVDLAVWQAALPGMLALLNSTVYDVTGRYVPASAYLAATLPDVLDHPSDALRVQLSTWGHEFPPIPYRYSAQDVADVIVA